MDETTDIETQPVAAPIKPQPIDFFTSADGEIVLRIWVTPTELLTWHDAILEFMRLGVK